MAAIRLTKAQAKKLGLDLDASVSTPEAPQRATRRPREEVVKRESKWGSWGTTPLGARTAHLWDWQPRADCSGWVSRCQRTSRWTEPDGTRENACPECMAKED
jgi:hypothetical protein